MKILPVLLLVLVVTAPTLAGDWPAYRRDPQRSAATDESLAFPLRPLWEYRCAQPPAPAWGEQLNLLNRVDFDYAPHPVIAGGLLVFASSADDTIRALDAATGQEKWRFTTGGPVRVPPQIAAGKIYFGSDDGRAYCLDAATGKLIWSVRGSPVDERLIGNHRMISRWPVRSGVLVIDTMAYFVAGLWSNEGVFIYGVDAATGKQIWCDDTLGFSGVSMVDFIGTGVNSHHQGEFGVSGQSPQGPLVGNDKFVIMPNGYAAPLALDRFTGRGIKQGIGGAAGTGGTWLTLDGDRLYTFAKHGQGGNVLFIQSRDLATGGVSKPFPGVPQFNIGPRLKPGEIHEKAKVSALARRGVLHARKADGIAMAGTTLLLGHDGLLTAEETQLQTAAELRFGAAGDDLVVHARVVDRNVIQGATPWKGSCVELFGTMPGTPKIGQVFLVPATATEPAKAYRAQDSKPVAAPEIRLACAATKDGYEISALIPLSHLALDKSGPEYRLEVQVTVTGPDGTVQRDTLFGSESAYQSSDRYGPFKLKAATTMPSADKVKATLATIKPSTIMLRGNAEVWRTAVDGEAREIAIADGRVYVGTTTGMIYCFASDTAGERAKATIHDPAAKFRAYQPGAAPEDHKLAAQLKAVGADRGFAMVIGDAKGERSIGLAGLTNLRVVNVQTDPKVAAVVREEVLKSTVYYGTRIAVQTVDRLDRLPFAQFFANAVIVVGPADGLKSAGKELYRVLHPCGGVLMTLGMKADDAAAMLEGCGAPAEEMKLAAMDVTAPSAATAVRITRGKLPGALDWDSPRTMTADQRVKWPLRPLWFGGPSTLQVLNYRQGADGPTVAAGRYFIKSETTLSAVDAYNGLVLWTRTIPKQWLDLRDVDGALFTVSEPITYMKGDNGRSLRANNDSVYLRLGAAYFGGRGDSIIQMDARTGEQKNIYGPTTRPTTVTLNKPQTWPIVVNPTHRGSVMIENTEAGLTLTLVTVDPAVTKQDAWDLCFDFRAVPMRYGIYERGAFHLQVTPARDSKSAATWRFVTAPVKPSLTVTGTRERDGTHTVVTIPWPQIQQLVGGEVTSFGLAVSLNSHDGGREEPIVRRHLFGDWCADGINNGWTNFVIANDHQAVASSVATATAPAIPLTIVAGPFGALKDPSGFANRSAVLATSVAQAPRIHPLTGEPEPKVYRPSTLCGASYFSDQLMSGRAGFYDFADDSGLRFLGGIKSRCTTPQVVALGMILISEETGHCSCNYPMRTTLALAPAERRLNEDWALFHDRDADTLVRHAAIMLGAPGDRRDEDGQLWLGFPRPPADKGMGYSLIAGGKHNVTAKGVWPRFTSSTIQVPLDVKSFDGPDAYRPEDNVVTYRGWSTRWAPNLRHTAYGPRRFNPDRVVVAGTDRPWMYASQFRGIQSATLRVNFIKPIGSQAVAAPPVIDGKVNDTAWAGEPQIALPFTDTRVRIRHDKEKLYIATTRPAVINRQGQVAPWTAATKGDDAKVWTDDSIEVFLSDGNGRVMHLGVSASGARYDALAKGTAEVATAATTAPATQKTGALGMDGEDAAWNGEWTSAASGDETALRFELAVPLSVIAQAGLDKDRLGINVQVNQIDVTGEELKYPGNTGRNYDSRNASSEAMFNLGASGRTRCANFAPLGLGAAPATPVRRFTVRLHFAEIDDTPAGQRAFDVNVQGKPAWKNVDITRDAGGPRRALVKELTGVEARDAIDLEFIPATPNLTPDTAPILSAIEVLDEGWAMARK